jgi:WXG100 family type VII secretion target
MPAPIIRIDLDTLSRIAASFSSGSADIQQMLRRVNQQVGTLRSGDWIGVGATKFYDEMENDVVPALTRLAAALESADRITRQIKQIMEGADDEMSRIFAGLLGIGTSMQAAAGSGAGPQVSFQSGGTLIVVDISSLFSAANLRGLIGSQFQGVGSQLGDVMNSLLQNPAGDLLDGFLEDLAKIRGRDVTEIRIEFERYQEAASQRDAAAAEQPASPSGGGGGQSPSMGSNQQMRYGSVVGDAFGIDPALGAMLNPSGGLMGPGNYAIADPDTPAGYHSVAHDAAGYLYNYHNAGPGYDYLGSGDGDPSKSGSGESAAMEFWHAASGAAGPRKR